MICQKINTLLHCNLTVWFKFCVIGLCGTLTVFSLVEWHVTAEVTSDTFPLRLIASTMTGSDTGWLVSMAVLIIVLLWAHEKCRTQRDRLDRLLKFKMLIIGLGWEKRMYLCDWRDATNVSISKWVHANCCPSWPRRAAVPRVLYPPVNLHCHGNTKAPPQAIHWQTHHLLEERGTAEQ